MKRLILTLNVLIIVILFQVAVAQSPGMFNYQAVIRDAEGALIRNTQVGMQISILRGSPEGAAVYVEEFTVITNVNGLITLKIGSASQGGETKSLKSDNGSSSILVSGDLSSIDWSDGPYFLKVDTDPEGGTNYTITGTSQLLSVPYALQAKSVSVPLELAGNTPAASSVIKGTNNGSGYGVYGWSSANYGVNGYSSSSAGIFGYSNDAAGVDGINGSSGNEGKLGTNDYGVTGLHASTGNSGHLGTSFSGIVGIGKGTSDGVYGSNENGNYGYLGGSLYALWASAESSNSYAGYFLGKTTVSGGSFELRNPTGENWFSFLRGTDKNAGFAFKEEGAADTQWIFPYFRGWQSDNLIVRDEAAKKDVMTFEAGTGNIGINIANPTEKLEVNGKVKIGEYTLPSSDGAKNDVLVTDGAGTVAWSSGGASMTGGMSLGGSMLTAYMVSKNMFTPHENNCGDDAWVPLYSGATEGFCIERDERSALSWIDAVRTCLQAGKRLPEPAEWQLSCYHAGTLGLSNMTGNFEWVSNFPQGFNPIYGGGLPDIAVRIAVPVIGKDNCKSSSLGSLSAGDGGGGDTLTYRCVH